MPGSACLLACCIEGSSDELDVFSCCVACSISAGSVCSTASASAVDLLIHSFSQFPGLSFIQAVVRACMSRLQCLVCGHANVFHALTQCLISRSLITMIESEHSIVVAMC